MHRSDIETLEAFVDLVGARVWSELLAALHDLGAHTRGGRALLSRHSIELAIERRRRRPDSPATPAEARITALAAEAVSLADTLPMAGRMRLRAALLAAFALYGLSASFLAHPHPRKSAEPDRVAPLGASDAILEQCARLRNVPGPGPSSESDLLHRERSDRFEPGTRPTLIKNVTLWTGARNGTEIVYGDILLDKGLVQAIGYVPEWDYSKYDTDVIDAQGGWVTPGLGTCPVHVLGF